MAKIINRIIILKVLALSGYASALTIVQKPILFNEKRTTLTKDYRKTHYGIDDDKIEIIPRMIVIHWTETENIGLAHKSFYKPVLAQRPDLKPSATTKEELNVSSHYIVDRDGTIYQLMPVNVMARHIIGLNNIAVGIENVGGVNKQDDLTNAQVVANLWLVKLLAKQYPTIKYLIGHFEYTRFKNTPLWLEKDKTYLTNKKDPGKRFMELIRKNLGGIKLKDRF